MSNTKVRPYFMSLHALIAKCRGIPKSLRAWLKFFGTSLLAGITCAMFGGGISITLGKSPLIAGSVSGVVATVIVAIVILRYGQEA